MGGGDNYSDSGGMGWSDAYFYTVLCHGCLLFPHLGCLGGGDNYSDSGGSERPLLNWLNAKGEMESMQPAHVQKELADSFKFKADWTRHVGQRFLIEKQVDEAIISAIFAHEMFGQETWQKHSSMSVGTILAIKSVYDELAEKLELQQIDKKDIKSNKKKSKNDN